MPGGFPFGGHGRRRGRGRPRVRRGAIRAGILLVLAERPMHGYEVMSELAARSGGMWRPSPGSVYPTLQQLEDEDLVRAADVEGKRVFSLTDAGRAVAEKLAKVAAPWDAVVNPMGDDVRSLHESNWHLSAAVQQIAVAGTDEQIAAASQVLDDARKRIYRLLAEDEVEDDATDEPS